MLLKLLQSSILYFKVHLSDCTDMRFLALPWQIDQAVSELLVAYPILIIWHRLLTMWSPFEAWCRRIEGLRLVLELLTCTLHKRPFQRQEKRDRILGLIESGSPFVSCLCPCREGCRRGKISQWIAVLWSAHASRICLLLEQGDFSVCRLIVKYERQLLQPTHRSQSLILLQTWAPKKSLRRKSLCLKTHFFWLSKHIDWSLWNREAFVWSDHLVLLLCSKSIWVPPKQLTVNA